MEKDVQFSDLHLFGVNDGDQNLKNELLAGDVPGMQDKMRFGHNTTDRSSISDNWKKQVELAQISRLAKAPHFHAHLAAQSKRSENPFFPHQNSTVISQASLSPHKGLRLRDFQSQELDVNPRTTQQNYDINQGWTELDVSGIGIRTLAPQVVQYEFLTHLYLSHNNLTEVHPGILKLKNLFHLDISGNRISVLPEKMGNLTNLRTLLLFDNNISSIPFEFGRLFHLQMLGLDGNPLLPQFKQKLIELGTQPFIAKLRDSAPLSMPPPPREWLMFNESKSTNNCGKIKVMNYNILCNKMASPQLYGYTPSWALDWDYRKELILLDIQEHFADIICLQELDIASFEDYFLPNLVIKGYKGVHFPKSRAKTMNEVERRFVDGCAIFYKEDLYSFVDKHLIEFNQANPLKRGNIKPTHDMYNRVMTKDNISGIICLENKDTKQKFLVVNAHIYWDPKFPDVKLIQVTMLLDEVAYFSRSIEMKYFRGVMKNSGEGIDKLHLPIIICGDFNSEPTSAVYDYLSRGSFPPNLMGFQDFQYGDYVQNGKSHRLGLKSAYGLIDELPFTNYTPGFVGVLDYIWYSSSYLEVTGLLGEVFQPYVENSVGFPDAHFPSDHICVMAELRIK